jgi:hypothetical protein
MAVTGVLEAPTGVEFVINSLDRRHHNIDRAAVS